MEKPWLKNYPAGVPAEINPLQYSSLNALFDEACVRNPDRPAFTNMGRTLSYGELDQRVSAFAAWLKHSAGMSKGERMAIMLPNVLQYPIALFGALRAGLIIVNVNPLYTAHELEHQLVDSGAAAIVVLENFAATLQAILGKTALRTVIVTGAGDLLNAPKGLIVNAVLKFVRKQVPAWDIPTAVSLRRVLSAGKYLPPARVVLGHSDIAFLQYTGGTTGVAKGAMLSHRNMVANVLQSTAWLGSTEGVRNEIAVTALPLYHIFSLTGNCLAFIKRGARILLITNPRDFAGFVKELGRYRFTFVSGVNTLFNALLNTPGFDRLDFSFLRMTLGGGMAVQASVAERWKAVTGNVLTQAWGLTETAPAACINPFQLQTFNGSIGLPISSTEISIRDDAGEEMALGQIGEICVRGPQVMEGYWNRPDETAKVMLPEGWLRTGDIGRVDAQGFVYIEDRKKDMIVVSGFNVYPNEVESVIAKHPAVLEVAAVAQADERSGEVVAVFVVTKQDGVTEHDIIEQARSELTGYKVPKHVYFRQTLPKTNVGKILRRALRDELPGRTLQGEAR